jgi:hypothetical protein
MIETIVDDAKLVAKELASALGVSIRYVYEMRKCGFQMVGEINYNQETTLKDARFWIHSNNFRIIRGVGRVDPVERIKVKNFWLQPTVSFSEGAPQREEYLTDADHLAACLEYGKEWRAAYECCNPECKNRDCPQHNPTLK